MTTSYITDEERRDCNNPSLGPQANYLCEYITTYEVVKRKFFEPAKKWDEK